MQESYDNEEHDCLDADRWDRGLILQSIVKAALVTGDLARGARALSDLRKVFGEQARVFETLTPYLPIGQSLSQELAEYRLGLLVEEVARYS